MSVSRQTISWFASALPLALTCSVASMALAQGKSPATTKPAAIAAEAARPFPLIDKKANAPIKPGDWAQWGGTSYRNNVPITDAVIPVEFDPGKFDRKTGAWLPATSKNIKWVAQLGSQTYGNPVISGGKIFVGTNNTFGYLKRYPADVDLGVLLCLDEANGKFLWQDSSEKLPTGRVNDWPLMGICCAPLVEGNRLWYVTSRGEVKCLDTEGFHDNEDDGPVKNLPAKLFELMRNEDPKLDQVAGILAGLKTGKLPEQLVKRFAAAGCDVSAGVAVKTDDEGKKWSFTAKMDGVDRQFFMTQTGPRFAAFRVLGAADKDEADVVWSYNMMTEAGVFQHNMCSCSVTSMGDILFVVTSNGVDDSHKIIPAPDAPSFMAMDKHTGKVYWTDKSPGMNIHHGQWTSPTVAVLGSVPQAIFGGGDGWIYSFRADKGKDGSPELLWKADLNPKEAKLILGGTGTRNDVIGTPVVYDGLVYVAVGQDPEHGEGPGHLWCIDPNKRGDVSLQLAVDAKTRKVIPHKRVQAVVPQEGDVAIDNPNSAIVWHYDKADRNENGTLDFDEEMHRSCGSVAIKDDLLFIADFSGIFHCIDAKSGKVHWTYDMLSAMWGSPLIVNDRVYIGDEDGDVCVFAFSADPEIAMPKREDENGEVKNLPLATISMFNSVYSTPVVANGVLYIENKDRLFAIQQGAQPPGNGK
jgi:outer membrane protein assembly factor BamB